MGYEKDFLHIIFKLNNKNADINYRIEDVVYDNKTSSIYFILSNSSAGSELIRLKRTKIPNKHNSSSNNQENKPFLSDLLVLNHDTNNNSLNYSYELASGWSFSLIYKNSTAKLLSLDVNVNSRKLYWFEFCKLNQKWSLVVYKMLANKLIFYVLNNEFNTDGYTFITVARDANVRLSQRKHELGRSELAKARNHKFSKKLSYLADIVVFISNNQTLNICFLINMTCSDYFQAPQPQISIQNKEIVPNKTNISSIESSKQDEALAEDEDEDDDDEGGVFIENNSNDDETSINTDKFSPIQTTTSTANTQTTVTQPSLYKFGRLMGIKYDFDEHALYLNDFGNDRIEKIAFDKQYQADDLENGLSYKTKHYGFKLNSIETILKSDLTNSGQIPLLNPIMSVVYDKSHLFWIDYEEGLKTTVFKSSCIRTIYKIKEPISLKFIQMQTIISTSSSSSSNANTSNMLLNKLVSLNNGGKVNNLLKYPPDYYNYYQYTYDFNSLDSLNGNHVVNFEKLVKNNSAKRIYFSFYSIFCIVLFKFCILN